MAREDLVQLMRLRGFPTYIGDAFAQVPREHYVPDQYREVAYADIALSLGRGSSISQPSTIAFMLKLMELEPLLTKSSKILEIGSGSGYTLALIKTMMPLTKIIGLELNQDIAKKSIIALKEFKDIMILPIDGYHGLQGQAPFDRIILSAAAPNIMVLTELMSQVCDGGILVAPLGNSIVQMKKTADDIFAQEFHGFSFVPLQHTGPGAQTQLSQFHK